MSKLWGGRFKQDLHHLAKQLSFSVHTDVMLAEYDIRVNQVHAEALYKAGVLSKDEFNTLFSSLSQLMKACQKGDLEILDTDEDIHSVIERLVIQDCGELGKKLHTGKSRNDQVATDTRLYVKQQCLLLAQYLLNVQQTFYQMAATYKEQCFPGYTHMQPAQPILLGHYFLAYFQQFNRDRKRIEQVFESADSCPLGSGAMAGNNYQLDRQWVASQLGFSKITDNSMDAVSDRDYQIECLSALSIIMMHLSRCCEELILFSSPQYGFFEIGEAYTTGSSIMPQKKNPDIAELIRGKTGRVTGALMAFLQMMKGLPLTYNRDQQEDKPLLKEGIETVSLCLQVFDGMMHSLVVHKQAIQNALQKGYLEATELADYLTKKNIPFRQAHEITGQIVRFAIDKKKALNQISISEFQQFSGHIQDDIYKVLSIEAAINAKNVIGGTALSQVNAQLKKIQKEFGWNAH